MKDSKGLMVLGTASDVGKSFLVAAICRYLANQGLKVSPFKSQNMTRSIVELPDKTLISKSTYLQARAAKLEADARMNPLILKPSQGQVEVYLLGHLQARLGSDSFRDKHYENSLQVIEAAFKELSRKHDVLVLEGAGSPVELNLKDRELVNFKIAELTDLPVLLLADIDRGGVFASLVGTLELLTEAERSRVKGLVINKFRGDPATFAEGLKIIEEKTKLPVLGLIPYYDAQAELSEEESNQGQTIDFDQQLAHVEKHLDFEALMKIINDGC